MKKIIVLIVSALHFLGCTQKNSPKKETTAKYFNARNSVDYTEIECLLHDSLTIAEGDYKMLYSTLRYSPSVVSVSERNKNIINLI